MRRRKIAQDREVASKTIEKGLPIVNTGKGKGKAAAAFGLILRALGQGWNIGVVQFIKRSWNTGERRALEERYADRVSWRSMGEGFTWETEYQARDVAPAEAAWARVQALMAGERVRLILLDELIIALRYAYLPIDKVVETLVKRRAYLHVVATGRHAPPILVVAADLGAAMNPTRHQFAGGVMAQAGIEY
jgi:cob(I)alamin adenosyltransferase